MLDENYSIIAGLPLATNTLLQHMYIKGDLWG